MLPLAHCVLFIWPYSSGTWCVWRERVAGRERVPLPPVPPRTTTVLEAGTTELRVDGTEGGKMNGAFVMEWDEVQVLATNDLGFSWIKVGRKKGWLRSEYLQQDE